MRWRGGAKILGYTTSRRFIKESFLDGKEVIPFEELGDRFDKQSVRILNTIGYTKMNSLRERVNNEIEELGFTQYSYISPRAFVGINVESLINKGCIIMPNAFIGTDVQIGNSVVIYSNCSLTHDIVIGDNCFLGSGCVIGGNVVIGNNCFIGMNSTIKNRVILGAYTLVGCGSNVLKTIVDEKCVVVGNPAKVLVGKNSLNTF